MYQFSFIKSITIDLIKVNCLDTLFLLTYVDVKAEVTIVASVGLHALGSRPRRAIISLKANAFRLKADTMIDHEDATYVQDI